ncbi:MAG: hypothetical protein NXH95_13610 [Pseudomonadaceae bacterium]|nr:hypothetical protein [Pseudomonadaceae bacterium]
MGKAKMCFKCGEILLDETKCDDCGAVQKATDSDDTNAPDQTLTRVDPEKVEFRIEKDVPLPSVGNSKHATVYDAAPFAEMKIDDSLRIPLTNQKDLDALYAGVRRYVVTRFPESKWAMRILKEECAVRIWRTK